MSMLNTLKDNQDLILLAEIGALIHDVGKLSKEFVIKQSAECDADKTCFPECNFDHEQILKDTDFLGSPLVGLLQGSNWRPRLRSEAVNPLKQTPEHLGHFISGHTNLHSGMGLLALVTRCDQVDSGVDKGMLQDSAKQRWVETHIASVFGYERPLLIDPNQDALQAARDKFTGVLERLLSQVLTSQTPLDRGSRAGILEAAEDAFRHALGETRRAANDVSLWDHAFSVASLQKAALAQVLLKGQWPSDLRQLQWRILRIPFNGLDFLAHAHRIPDLLSRLQVVREAMDRVRSLLEVTFPLGNEIYRDENGSAFVVPDVSDLLDVEDNEKKTLRRWIAEEFGKQLQGEIRLHLSDKWLSDSSRYSIELGRLQSRPLPPLTADPDWISQEWQRRGGEVCTVCGVRPQGPSAKAQDRNVCDVCEERRADRSKDWATKGMGTTIWTDEVADINGRLALVVARFDLTAWLDGRLLSSILAQEPPPEKTYQEIVGQLAEELKSKVEPNDSNPPLLQKLAPEAFRPQNAGAFYQAVVEERDIHNLLAGIAEHDYHAKAEHLLLFLLRKNPSFARLRRIWETTRQFWQGVCPTDERSALADSVVGQRVGQAGPRLEIRGNVTPRQQAQSLGPYHTYELVLPRGIRLSVVWDEQNKRFITCGNLGYLASEQRLGRPVQEVLMANAEFTVEEPVGYGAANKVWGTITLTQDATPILSSNYIPAIPILAEPQTFMALVPAQKALKVVQEIKAKYEREMGKVRNRLPLHLGVIFAHRRTPVRAILEAGRRILDVPTHLEEQWQIQQIQDDPHDNSLPNGLESDPHFARWRRILLERDGHQAVWYVPLRMGDGATKDVWYPYAFAANSTANQPVEERQRVIKSVRPKGDGGTAPCWLVHAEDLVEGDSIYFTPSTFDFEFLDTTARRFEIHYDENGHRPRRTRPFYLEDLDRLEELWGFMKRLAKTQRHQVIRTIEATRETWYGQDQDGKSTPDEVFRQFVADTLAGAEWRKEQPWRSISEKWRQELIQAGVRGELADLAELHMEILKED